MINKLLLMLILCFSFTYCKEFAHKYNYETDYTIALQKAKDEKKDIVFVLVSDFCPWCDRLKSEVLSLEYTDEILKEYYIPLIVNTNYDNKFPDKFDSYIVPTIHFVSYIDESIIESVVGFNSNYRFYEIIEKKAE